jgi:hypothetical protein
MRRLILPAAFLLGIVMITGCARNYTITLNNGRQIGTTSKPKLVNGEAYYYKDMSGRESRVAAGSVAEISPTSMTKESKGPLMWK